MYNFDKLLNRKNTDCTKWDALERDFGRSDLMPFWVADADFPILPDIVESLRNRCSEEQSFGYTTAGKSFYQSVIAWNKKRHGLDCEKSQILQVPGVVTGLSVILMALTEPVDKVLINPPVYTPFFDVVRGLKRTLVESPLVRRDGKYGFDFEDLEAKLAGGVKAWILCSPHNPVGRVWTRKELQKALDLCRKYKVQMISDEIHYDIVLPGHTHTAIPLLDPNAVMVTAPSKTFNIAGLKTSYIISQNPEIRGKILEWVKNLHLYCNLFGLRATSAAYDYGAAWVDELNEVLLKNAEFTVNYFQKNLPQVDAYIPESTYLMWLDFSGFKLPGEEISRKLVEEAGVALNPGSDYGTGYESFARLNIAVPRWYLEEGLQKITAAFSK